MTDKKLTEPVGNSNMLTDNEIIKALKCCGRESCFGCPYRGKCHQGNPMIKDAIDLINRQKAEIEQWQEEANRWQTLFCQEIHNREEIEAEAYKEFAEKLKEKIGDCHIVSDGEYCGFDCGDIHRCIDNFLKEMVGEEE